MLFTRFAYILTLVVCVVHSYEHIILIGNPGSGKSTILNSLIDEIIFSSGVSLGTGRTKYIQTYIKDLVKYSDTPGLDDIESKEAAAKEIERLFTESDNVKLVFVITLDKWRIKPADAATIQIVLDSLGQGDMTNRFTVLVNEASVELANVLSQRGEAFKLFQKNLFKTHSTEYFLFQDLDMNAWEKASALIDVSELKENLYKLPSISVDKSKLQPIDVKSIETVKKEYDDQMKALISRYEKELQDAKQRKPKRRRGLLGNVLNVVSDVAGLVEKVGNI